MWVLPGVVGGASPGRAHQRTGAATALAAMAVLGSVAVLAGCSRFDAALGQRQAIVSLRDGTPGAEKLIVRAAGAKVPAVTPPALPADPDSPSAPPQLPYQGSHPS